MSSDSDSDAERRNVWLASRNASNTGELQQGAAEDVPMVVDSPEVGRAVDLDNSSMAATAETAQPTAPQTGSVPVRPLNTPARVPIGANNSGASGIPNAAKPDYTQDELRALQEQHFYLARDASRRSKRSTRHTNATPPLALHGVHQLHYWVVQANKVYKTNRNVADAAETVSSPSAPVAARGPPASFVPVRDLPQDRRLRPERESQEQFIDIARTSNNVPNRPEVLPVSAIDRAAPPSTVPRTAADLAHQSLSSNPPTGLPGRPPGGLSMTPSFHPHYWNVDRHATSGQTILPMGGVTAPSLAVHPLIQGYPPPGAPGIAHMPSYFPYPHPQHYPFPQHASAPGFDRGLVTHSIHSLPPYPPYGFSVPPHGPWPSQY